MSTNFNTARDYFTKSAKESAYTFLLHCLTDSKGNIDGKAIYALSYMVAYSTLKKCISAGQTAEKENHENIMQSTSKVSDLTKIIAQVSAYSEFIERIETAENSLNHEFNDFTLVCVKLKDGKIKLKEKKITRYNDISPIPLDCMDKGSDLVETINLEIMESVRKQQENGQPINFELSYKYDTIGKRIYINMDRPTTSDLTVKETTPIQQIYRTASRYIYGESKRVDTSKYAYALYEMLYSDNTYETYIRNLHGITQYETLEKMQAVLAKVIKDLQLTDRQADILTDRLNLSLNQIAEKYSITKATVCKTLRRIGEKYNKYYGTSYGYVVDSNNMKLVEK